MEKPILLEAVFDRAMEGLLVTDCRGVIVLANPAFYRLFGYTSDEAAGLPLGQLLETVAAALPWLTGNSPRELNGRKKDGTLFPLRLSLASLETNDGSFYAGNIQDLSQEQTQATSLARERQLGQLKSRLVSMASHEFRSPLSQIQLSASLVERYYQRLDQEKIIAHLQKIRLAVNDQRSLLNKHSFSDYSLQEVNDHRLSTADAPRTF